jgi:amino acid transporter
MENKDEFSISKKVKELVIGEALSPHDRSIFHHLSLIAFFAWVGLGSDGLSSSCYGPEEAFKALGHHTHLAIFVALASAFTIFVISASYNQVIELFPTGGGGYLVASKLLSPKFGMIAGCALIIDYVLTIAISIASGADALFSFLPAQWNSHKLEFAVLGVILLSLMNLRGVKESVVPLVPIFLIFVLTHLFAILYAFITHAGNLPDVYTQTVSDVKATSIELGWFGMFLIILRAYSLGAGTYTGIEAVSNGLPILREPKVQTGKRTMTYMATSLAITVVGLMIAYLLFDVKHSEGKTLNAVLFESITHQWPKFFSDGFVWITLISEAAILFVAAQTGFLGGPRVLSNMSLDRWFPTQFAMLSDRLVTQNGIVLMGMAALVTIILTKGSVGFLVVLYSINVFITFVLTQMGMVRHWTQCKENTHQWRVRFSIALFGLILTSFILVTVTILKFNEGGWITLIVTGLLVVLVLMIKRHYQHTLGYLKRLDTLVKGADITDPSLLSGNSAAPKFDPNENTAVLLVNGFNGLGLHTLFSIIRLFKGFYKNYVFVQVGVIDAGNFKGAEEVEKLQGHIRKESNRYVEFMKRNGYYAESFTSIGNDIVEQVSDIAPKIQERFPQSVFFGGQLVFPKDTIFSRWLHNYIAFSIQRRFYRMGIPFVILPIRV